MTPEEELNNKWNMHQVMEEVLKAGHINPAPETIARLKTLEANHINFMEKQDNIEEKIDKLTLIVATLPEKILEKTDRKYASKSAEVIIYGMVGIIVAAVLYALLHKLNL
jgi:hypothetical protein